MEPSLSLPWVCAPWLPQTERAGLVGMAQTCLHPKEHCVCVSLWLWQWLCGSGCVAVAVWQCGCGCVAVWLCGCGCGCVCPPGFEYCSSTINTQRVMIVGSHTPPVTMTCIYGKDSMKATHLHHKQKAAEKVKLRGWCAKRKSVPWIGFEPWSPPQCLPSAPTTLPQLSLLS